MYRIVHCRMWRRGGSFRRLSGPKTPNAQHLWLYLLTGDATVSIPGVIPIERESLAARLGWKAGKAFDRCVEEISVLAMAEFDWAAGLVWCPSAFSYNRPQSPNVVKSWGKAFDVLPECQLKTVIWEAIRDYCDELGEAFAKAFAEAFPEAYDEGSLFPVTDTDTNRKKIKSTKASAKEIRDAVGATEYDAQPGFNDFWTVYPRKDGKQRALAAWKKARKERRVLHFTELGKKAAKYEQITIVNLIAHVETRAQLDRQWIKDDGEFIPHATTFLNQSRWMDEWKPDKRLKAARAGLQDDDDKWMYDTFRRSDYVNHGPHERWKEYAAWAAEQPPRSAMMFEDWLRKGG